jgi:hypothetical protein
VSAGPYQLVHCACAHGVDDVEQELQYEDHQEERRHGCGRLRYGRLSGVGAHRMVYASKCTAASSGDRRIGSFP